MKGLCAFFLGAAALFAADFTNGQAGRAVIGQITFTAADPNSSATVLGADSGIAFAANTLFVVDDNRMGALPENNRVLIFSNLTSMLPAPDAELSYTTKCPVCVGQASVVLGQPDFSTDTTNLTPSPTNLRQPTAVASDGVRLVVADTNHNRVLIWNRIPTSNNTPADVVVGQKDLISDISTPTGAPTASSLLGPQGVWIQNGHLYIADTQNNRVLLYNQIPSSNGAAADVVLGAPNFTTALQTTLNTAYPTVSASQFINPVSVTSDGVHLFVTDLGANRVLIWNSIPTSNGAPADVEIGQPDMTQSVANNAFDNSTTLTNGIPTQTPVLCTVSNGVDTNNNPTYPSVCNATLNFPRFALSDGTRLFIADGGNDRVLEFETIPTTNAASADTVLGQVGGTVDEATDATDSMNTPDTLAWDGTNLYVSDPYNRRIMVYTPLPNILPYQAVVNAASQDIVASGTVAIGGTIKSGDILTITVNTVNYTYTVKATDAISDVVNGLVASVNAGAGDPNVLATANQAGTAVILTAKVPGAQGNNIDYTATQSSGATTLATAAGTSLTGGGQAAQVGPGTIVQISGTGLSSGSASADLSQNNLPTDLVSTQVYLNGIASPLYSVSPTLITAQVPWEFTDTTSVNVYIRSVMSDGSVMVTSPVALSIVPANPGIFTLPGTNPPLAAAYHAFSTATGLVSVDGTVHGGDIATVTIQDRTYNYTVVATDTLDSIRDALVSLINTDPEVTARAADAFDRIILQAQVEGPEGEGIAYTAVASVGASLTMTAFSSALCCDNVAGAPVSFYNPAVAGEMVYLYATGLGLPALTAANTPLLVTGQKYPVGAPNTLPQPAQFVAALAGGTTADLLDATLVQGTFGEYQVLLHLNDTMPTNIYTGITIAQSFFVSNVASIAVVAAQ